MSEDALVREYTKVEIIAGNGIGRTPWLFTINGKVVDNKRNKNDHIGQLLKKHRNDLGVIALEILYSRVFYDPKYGVIDEAKQITRELAADIEDQMCTWKKGGDSQWHVVGRFD